jgi:hypothetical protein
MPGRAGWCGLVALGLLTALLSSGCEKESIAHYQVPKETRSPQRLLAAIVPHGEQTWFFKLLGTQETVSEHEKEFEQFLESVHFGDRGKPGWTLPEGWRQVPSPPGKEIDRYATLQLGLKDKPLEVLVTPLGRNAGDLLENVNRWRGQMGLLRVAEDGLGKMTRVIKVGGQAAILVDIKADEKGLVAGPPPAAPRKPTWTLPEGWTKSDRQVPFSIATFRTGDKDPAEVTVSPFAGGAGGLLPNVNRWRGQVGLKPITNDELQKESAKLKVAGIEAKYFDMASPKPAGEKRQRILVAVVVQGGTTWIFKMMGLASAVEKQKPDFEAFLKSVRFEGRGVKQ